MPDTCNHLDQAHDVSPSSQGCEDEPGEDWWWCFDDEIAFTVDGAPSFAHR